MSKSNITNQNVQVEPSNLYVGVDLGLERNVGVILTDRGDRADRFSFSQDRQGYDYFLQRLQGLREKYQAPEVIVGMEPSNYFWKLLAFELEKQKIQYRLVNAYTVKKYREGDQLDRSKDDQRDANQIAELCRTGKTTQTRLQKGAYQDLRQYATLYHQYKQAMHREKTIIWGLTGQVFPELLKEFDNLAGSTCRSLLIACAPAVTIRQMALEQFVEEVRAAYQGRRFGLARLKRVYHLAENSIGILEGVNAIQLAIQVHFANLESLETQLERVTAAMTNCLLTLPEAPYLLSCTALQPLTAALFLGEVGDPQRYGSASQWVKLAGIQPAPNTSGKKQRSRTPMSHQGRAQLRTLLYFACLHMVRFDTHFAELYSQLQREPKTHSPKCRLWVCL
jgi:transposase